METNIENCKKTVENYSPQNMTNLIVLLSLEKNNKYKYTLYPSKAEKKQIP